MSQRLTTRLWPLALAGLILLLGCSPDKPRASSERDKLGPMLDNQEQDPKTGQPLTERQLTSQCDASIQQFILTIDKPILEKSCIGCHSAGGMASRFGSDFLLEAKEKPFAFLSHFQQLSLMAIDPEQKLSQKPSGALPHYGGTVLDPQGKDYAALQAFIASASSQAKNCAALPLEDLQKTWRLKNDREYLAFITQKMAARPPKNEELTSLAQDSDAAIRSLIVKLMQEKAFGDRLMEEFNLLLLTDSYTEGNLALQELFGGKLDELWFATRDKWPNPGDFDKARSLTNDSLARRPLERIRYVINQGRAFSEILTADYEIYNPYLACLYGVQDQLRFQSEVNCQPHDNLKMNPDEWVQGPARTQGAGLLSDPIFLVKHPTTETNRNRHRANTVSTNFLGFDILELSQSRVAASSISENNPTMNSRACTICHSHMDPIAGTFQGWQANGQYRKQVWYKDLFAPGFGDNPLPVEASETSLRFLAEKTSQDPRFAVQMTRVFARAFLNLPMRPELSKDPKDSVTMERYLLIESAIQKWSDAFVKSQYQITALLQAMFLDPLARLKHGNLGEGLGESLGQNLSLVKVSTPQHLARRIRASFGQGWTDGNGKDQLLARFYNFMGGVDSESVVKTPEEFSGLMAQLSQRLAAELPCRYLPIAFSSLATPEQLARRNALFPEGEKLLQAQPDSDLIQRSIRELLFQLWGEDLAADDPTVLRFIKVFQDIHQKVKADPKLQTLAPVCQVLKNAQGEVLPDKLAVKQDSEGRMQGLMAWLAIALADSRFLVD